MVKVCTTAYSKEQEQKYIEYFENYSFPLSNFQKYAIEAIVEGHHILVTAHTGSGKTLPAEFAIEFFVKRGKKVIYTSPIKALSNQKFYEFTKKFPDISFGVITGDIKCNPDADVLIMTTEILLNKLYQNNSSIQMPASAVSFDMDINNELACVIFDEVHYINDADRGKVWEQSIMMLPLHIQMVMLSATIDQPEKFANWCQTRGSKNQNQKQKQNQKQNQDETQENEKHEKPMQNPKEVYLTTTYERVVPLTHYSFITTNNAIFKITKDKELEKQIRDITNKPFTIQSAKGVFDEVHFQKMRKTLDLFETKRVFVKRSHVLNQVCKYMVENEMLPALCFVLSRKQLEVCAKEITTPLLEFDSKVPYIVRRECEQIIRKLPNYKEYLSLPEYMNMVALLEKGIAIHHAGVMPVLREMVELLYAKGYIKLLFATETFAVGINMPTKTTIFTSLEKFDGNGMRMLYSHEYTQMAGRAGRRGLDTIGHVIHLNNLFRNVTLIDYKKMMQGKPQTLISKFKISFNLLLNLVDIGDQNFLHFVQRSMIQEDLDNELNLLLQKMEKINEELVRITEITNHLRSPTNILQEYKELSFKKPLSVNKKRKEIERRLEQINEEYTFIEKDVIHYNNYLSKQKEYDELQDKYTITERYLNNNVQTMVEFLKTEGFLLDTINNNDADDFGNKNENITKDITLTFKGTLAVHLREIHCLVFANLLEKKRLENMTSKQLVAVFSCFTNITTSEDKRALVPYSEDTEVQNTILELRNQYDHYLQMESETGMESGTDYNIHFDIISYVMDWCDAENTEECKLILQKMENEKEIFLGEFVKALLKINNISCEMEKIAEQSGAIRFLSVLREIPVKTLKFVVTNQSLYI